VSSNTASALRVLVVPDKFKGTLTAREAAEAIARGWHGARPGDTLDLLPMSDGGDGFGEILGNLAGAEARRTPTQDAAHRPCEAAWWWHAPTATATVESARVIGLAMLPRGQYHPFDLDTLGLAALLKAAADAGARRCLVGIGGSATNDAGFGLARGLGWQFLDAAGAAIERWTNLFSLERLVPPPARPRFEELTVAVDVQNPLLGPEGCSRVYGPQKGLTEFDVAERALSRLVEVLRRDHGLDGATQPGDGAAGGLGFGLRVFAGGRLAPGFDLFARAAGLAARVRASALVVTGEGAIDPSSLMGKGVGEVARLCREAGVPCLGLGGAVLDKARASSVFTATFALAPDLATPEQAMARPAFWLERAAAQAAAAWPIRGS
jgi:glycerate kinase